MTYVDPGEDTRRRRKPTISPDGPNLFSHEPPVALPYAKTLDQHHTSRDAAYRLAPVAGSIRRIILDTLIAAHPNGLTRKEIAEQTQLAKDTVNGGAGVWFLCREGWAIVDGQRGHEGIVKWSGKQP